MKTVIQPPAGTPVEQCSTGPVWLDPEGIVISVINGCDQHTLEDAIAGVATVSKVSGYVCRPLLVDFTRAKGMSREAREYYASNKREMNITAMAIITSSAIGRMVANFFLGINKAPVPTRLFNDPGEARIWLKKHLPANPVQIGQQLLN